MFVVGGRSSEVFDSNCGKFVWLKTPQERLNSMRLPFGAVLIGNKLIVLCSGSSKVFFYDVVNEIWASESCELTKSSLLFGCAKISQLK